MHRVLHVLALAALAAGCLLAAGCGSSSPPAPTRRPVVAVTVPTGATSLSPTAPRRLGRGHRRRALHGPAVGATQETESRGSRLTITVENVVDPLSGSGAALLPGSRAVAILVRLVNAGPALYDSSATGDFSVLSTRGPVTPVFVPHGLCQTPVEDFDRYMSPGDERSGCVAFALPASARVLGVRFEPHAAAAGQLTWVVK